MTTKAQYIQNQIIIRNRMIRMFTPSIYAALQSQISDAVAIIKNKGLNASQGNIHVMNSEIGKAVTELYRAAAIQAIKKYRLNRKAAFGFNEDFVKSVLDFFGKYLLNNVVIPISQTTINFIEQVLQKAISLGWGVDQTVKELEDSEITKVRARMIVRTETVRATNFAQLVAADNEDYEVQKKWIAIEDKRTRPSHSHAGVDGELVDLYEPYSNGLMFPGDPQGSAEEVINCRCTQGYFLKRDANGRPIPKTNPGLNILTRINLGRLAA